MKLPLDSSEGKREKPEKRTSKKRTLLPESFEPSGNSVLRPARRISGGGPVARNKLARLESPVLSKEEKAAPMAAQIAFKEESSRAESVVDALESLGLRSVDRIPYRLAFRIGASVLAALAAESKGKKVPEVRINIQGVR